LVQIKEVFCRTGGPVGFVHRKKGFFFPETTVYPVLFRPVDMHGANFVAVEIVEKCGV
jgi:hypothetical protein